MKYFYIALYFFYTKILFVQKDYPPIINITAVLSILLVQIIMILIEIFKFQYLYDYGLYLIIFLSILYMLIWYLFYKYYIKNEKQLIDEFKKKSNVFKITILFLFYFFILVIILVWFNRFSFFRE